MHGDRPRQSTTSIAAGRVGEPVQDQPVRERLSYQNVQARLGHGKRQWQVQGHLRAQAGLPLQARAGLSRRRDYLPLSYFSHAYSVGQLLAPPSAEAVRAVAAARETRADDNDSEDSDSFSSLCKGWQGTDEPMLAGRGLLRGGITDEASLLSPER